MINGIIVINKDAGYTSFDVVAKLRRMTGQKKAGHTGTLDPDARGVLVVCAGNATKVVSFLENDTKTYVAKMLLGVRTDTLDMTGTVTDRAEVNVSPEEVERVIKSFNGEIEQIPPMYSAVKINGRKLYEIARKGGTVERKARKVRIHSIEVLETDLPYVTFKTECSKGTYIRTLCDDIGAKLGCFGAMESLVRTRCGNFGIEEAHTLEELEKADDISRFFIPADSCFMDLPEIKVNKEDDLLIMNGNSLPCGKYDEGTEVRVYTSDGIFRGIYIIKKGVMKPLKMFL